MHKQKCSKTLKIFYQNVRGLRTKISKFLVLLEDSDADLFAITETGCNESIYDAELILPGYHILRCDRTDGRKHGGVLLVATPRFEIRQVQIPDSIDISKYKFEVVCANVYKQNRFLFTCCVVYIPPQTNEDEYLLMFRILETICNKYNNNVIILGDFNLFSCNNNISNCYEYFAAYCEVIQCNRVPNCNNRQLDLVLSGRSNVTVEAEREGLQPVDAYHPPLAVVVGVSAAAVLSSSPPSTSLSSTHERRVLFEQWNFAKADYSYLYYLISTVDWNDIYNIEDPDLALNFFYDKITDAFNTCIPLKNRNSKCNKRMYPVWYSSEIIKTIVHKHRLHKKYKKTKSPVDYEAFSRCRAKVKADTRAAHDCYRDHVQQNLASDPKAFWSFMRSKRSNTSQYKLIKGGQLLADHEWASEFAQFFQSVYSTTPATLDVAAASASGTQNGAGAWTHLGRLDRSEVRRALAHLPAKRSVGPDGIPPFILKDCRMTLVDPLLHIFNRCIAKAKFPDRWKLTRVVPIPKGKVGGEASDYRPVAILSTPAKIFESAIHNNMYTQVRSYLSEAQHGFRPGKSTTTNLLHQMATVIPAVDAGLQVDVAYLDFRKAFDTVDNDVLLCKLADVGFTPHTLKFFASYLSDRRQFVDCVGYHSEPYFTRSGVSQGSNLGPLLFVLMINDLSKIVKDSECLLFADDLKLSRVIRDKNTDHGLLQRDLDRVMDWSRQNKLYFNIEKCSILSFTRARTPSHCSYHMEGQPIQRVTEVRDLGITFTADLTFRKHITKVCRKAYRNLGFVLRQANDFNNIKALKALYEALVKSHMECNAAIWSPNEAKYATMLERIQNKFVRFLYLKTYGVYPGYPLLYPTLYLLGTVGYYRLEARREVMLATYLYNVLRGKCHNPRILGELRLCVPDGYVRRRRRPRLLVVPTARTELLKQAPMTRALHTLNAIAEQIDLFNCSVNDFTRVAYSVICY